MQAKNDFAIAPHRKIRIDFISQLLTSKLCLQQENPLQEPDHVRYTSLENRPPTADKPRSTSGFTFRT